MADTNVVTGNPPAVAGIVAGVLGTAAGQIAGFNAGAFDAYDGWVLAIGAVLGAVCGTIAQKWTKRYFPGLPGQDEAAP